MANTPILQIPQVAASQNFKEITINDGFVAVENATQASFTVTFTGNAATLSAAQFTGHVCFHTGAQSATATLTIPLSKRLFIVDNSTGSYTVTVGGSSGATVGVPAASLSFIYCDGTNCVSVIAGAATGVSAVVGSTGAVSLANLVAGGVAPSDSPTFTTVVNLPTVSGGDNSNKASSTSWVRAYATAFAPLASPVFTGAPSSTTAPASNDSSTAIPTTAWVQQLVQGYVQGMDVKDAVRVLRDSNITISSPGITAIDGVTLATGDRVALIAQSTASQNGIYIWNGSSSAMTRAPDADVSGEVTNGMFFWTSAGTTYGHTGWILTTSGTITLGTTSLAFTQFSGGGSTYTFSTGLNLTGVVATVDFAVVAPLASPTFTGTVRTPNPPTSNDNSTIVPNTQWVQTYIAGLGFVTSGSAPVTSVIGYTGAVTLANLVAGGVAPIASPTFSGAVTMSGAANVYVPTVSTGDNTTNAASTAFVQSALGTAVQGLSVKPAADVATTAALPTNTYSNGTSGFGATITMTATGTLTIDGHVTAIGEGVLVKNEATTSRNGLYTVTTAGAVGVAAVLTRSIDMNSASSFTGAFMPVGPVGTANANTLWLCQTSGVVTVGTTAITFQQLNGLAEVTANSGITITGNAIGVNFATVAALASPTFTGTPAGPTATAGTSTTQFATTAFVASGYAPLISPHMSAVAASAPVTINEGSVTTTAFANTLFQVSGTASARIEILSFGGASKFTGRRANGTAASPTASLVNDALFQMTAAGYGATGYATAGRGNIEIHAAENWTDTAQGAYASIWTTPNGSTTVAERVRVTDAGILLVGTTAATGSNLIQTASATIGSLTSVAISATGTVDLSAAASVLVLDPPTTADNSKHAANTEWVQSYVAGLGFVTSGSAPVTSVIGNTGSVSLASLVSGGLAPTAQGTVTATTTASITPTGLKSCVVNMGSTNATITVNGGFVGQELRVEIKQGATAHVPTFDSSVIFGTDITSYTATAVPNKRDLIQLIANTGSTWMFSAVNHGF